MKGIPRSKQQRSGCFYSMNRTDWTDGTDRSNQTDRSGKFRANTSGFTKIELLIVLAILLISAAVFVPPFLEPDRPRVSSAMNDMRSLATAIESYYVDHEAYPANVPLLQFSDKPNLLIDAGLGYLTTVDPGNSVGSRAGLTTPIGYCSSVFTDPLSHKPKNLPFAYYTDGPGWILISCGPDGDYDVHPRRDYDGNTTQPSARLLHLMYDPTNGDISSGDVIRVKQ